MIRNNKTTAKVRYSRTVLLILLPVFISFSRLSAQNAKEDQFPFDQKETKKAPSFRDRLFFGGSIGLQFGTITSIQLDPVVGYWLLPRVAVAVGPVYWYYKDQDVATTVYGGKGYLQLVLVQDLNSFVKMGVHTGIFLHLEDELLSLKSSFWLYPQPYTSDRFNVNTLLLGPGLSQQLGRRASLNFMVLWVLNDSGYNLYSNPEVRLSFSF
jgi:hypothetical protein